MFRALSTAATGMEAQQTTVNVISNNLANVNTAGFKKSRAEFQDLLYETVRPAGGKTSDNTQTPNAIEIGQGVRTVATHRQFTMGDMKVSGNVLDLAIEGSGFFQIVQPDGEVAFTRDGQFKLDNQGRLVNSQGYLLEPSVSVPAGLVQIMVGPDGRVSGLNDTASVTSVELGQIQTANFANPSGLRALGRNLYIPTPASGDAVVSVPGQPGYGSIASGYVEMSNVKVVEEMVDLIAAQRAYETNSKVVKAADEMLRSASSIRV